MTFISVIQYAGVDSIATTGVSLLQHVYLDSRRSRILGFHALLLRGKRERKSQSSLRAKKVNGIYDSDNSHDSPFSVTSQTSTAISLTRHINHYTSVQVKDLFNRIDWAGMYSTAICREVVTFCYKSLGSTKQSRLFKGEVFRFSRISFAVQEHRNCLMEKLPDQCNGALVTMALTVCQLEVS